MVRDKKVGADVTPAFYDRLERINENLDHGSISETVRHLLREGAQQYEQEPLAQAIFKHLAIGFAIVALVGYLWADMSGYPRPVYVGVTWMIPAVVALWLRELWPGISQRLGVGSANAAEA